MNASLDLLGALVLGALLGLLFFWGLWITLEGLPRSRRPLLRIGASALARFGAVLGGLFVLVRHGGWAEAAAAVVGFTAVRLVLVRHLRPRSRELAP